MKAETMKKRVKAEMMKISFTEKEVDSLIEKNWEQITKMSFTSSRNIAAYLYACYDAPRRAGMWEHPQNEDED